MARLTRGSWSSVRSRVLKALQRAEVPVIEGRRTKHLSPAWNELYEALTRDGRKAALGRFIGWLSDHDVFPHEVSDEIVERFCHELGTCSLRGRPNAIVRGAIRSWNAAVAFVPGWPQEKLILPEIERSGFVLPAQSFTPAFQKSLTDYIAYLADPPEDDEALIRGLRPATLVRAEFQFRMIASAVVNRGAPIHAITSLADLATTDKLQGDLHDALTGHADTSAGANYGDGLPLDDLKNGIDALTFQGSPGVPARNGPLIMIPCFGAAIRDPRIG